MGEDDGLEMVLAGLEGGAGLVGDRVVDGGHCLALEEWHALVQITGKGLGVACEYL